MISVPNVTDDWQKYKLVYRKENRLLTHNDSITKMVGFVTEV